MDHVSTKVHTVITISDDLLHDFHACFLGKKHQSHSKELRYVIRKSVQWTAVGYSTNLEAPLERFKWGEKVYDLEMK